MRCALTQNNQKKNFFFLSPNSLAKGLRATCEIRRAPKSPRATLTFYPESLALSDSAQLKKIFFFLILFGFFCSLSFLCVCPLASLENFFFLLVKKKFFFVRDAFCFAGAHGLPSLSNSLACVPFSNCAFARQTIRPGRSA